MSDRPPNVLLVITDQQRHPCHWPEEPGWVDQLMPNDRRLAQTGLRFSRAFCNTSMCSPSRATLLTGQYPAQHGVTLTHTRADLRPDPRNAAAVAGTLLDILRTGSAPRKRALRQFGRGLLQLGPKSGGEPELRPETPNLAQVLRGAGYEVGYKGKWHLTHPRGDGPLLAGWGPADAERLRRDYGFADWEPPDAGENAKAEHFGAGNAGPLGQGWDELYTRQAEAWLGRPDLPEPFCLAVSLVNPHDVLGYPAQYVGGGYSRAEFGDLDVKLPPTVAEEMSNKPTVHALMRMGMTAYLGPLHDQRAKLDYVNFYAHLHRVVDAQIGRLLDALGDPADPESLRSRTVIFRCADHGEMGLSHGGLRQKAFNAYEETIHIPLVVSNPVLFPEPAETDAFASLIDLLPTVATIAGAETVAPFRGRDLSPVLAQMARPERGRPDPAGLDQILSHPTPAPSVQDAIHFTYDDHQAATALQDVPGQPNRIRAVRTARGKLAVYFDPDGDAASEYELYDLERDPDEAHNLVDRATGKPLAGSDRGLRTELSEQLVALMAANETAPPAGSTV
ncbi:MAG: sulfatase-like hydrolase/transferase [Solirubrobacterales bacterium]